MENLGKKTMKKNKSGHAISSLTLIVWSSLPQDKPKNANWSLDCELVSSSGEVIENLKFKDTLDESYINSELTRAQRMSKTPINVIIVLPPDMTTIKKDEFSSNHKKNALSVAGGRIEPELADSLSNTHIAVECAKGSEVYIAAVSRDEPYKSQITALIKTFDKEYFKKLVVIPFQAIAYKHLGNNEYLNLANSTIISNSSMFFSLPEALLEDFNCVGLNNVSSKFKSSDLVSDLAISAQSRKSHPLNFATGIFSPKFAKQNKASIWKVGLIFLVILSFISVGNLFRQLANNNIEQATAINKETKHLFLRLVPSQGRVVRLRRQVDALLRLGNQTGQIDNINAYGVLSRLENVSSHFLTNSSIQNISLQDKTFSIEWQADNAYTLNSINKDLGNAGLNSYLDKTTKNSHGFIGRITITGINQK